MTKVSYQLALALSLVIGYALIVTGYVATQELRTPTAGAATPPWSKPLNGVAPYSVQRGYGTSGGITCDLAVYTTNVKALDGKGRLRPGDTTATVCVVRRADKPAPSAPELGGGRGDR
jgi:hypothetical protein